jgi:Ser/Thr protein kinase RdoA (MazF antagonist)
MTLRPFDTLTDRGKVTRLRTVARCAAARYGLETARMSFVNESFNTVFRLRTDHGGDFVLRVGAALRLCPAGTEEVELAWMDALFHDTGLTVAKVVRTTGRQVVTEASAPGVPEPRTCVVLTWIPGRMLRSHLDPDTAEQSGRLLAELHSHARAWSWPPRNAVPVADRVLYWQAASLLASVPRHGSLFAEALDRAQAAIDSLWAAPPHPPHLLHGDLTPDNIIQTRRGLAPIDFQDLVWGFDVQDVAISLLPYQRLEVAPSLTGRFRAGYEDVRPWPEHGAGTLEALFAARRLHMLNLALNTRPNHLDGYIDDVAARLARWMSC